MGKDLKSSNHLVIIGIQEVEPVAGQNWSGPWHDDGFRETFPLTTIIYFNHVNIRSKLSLKNNHAPKHLNPIYTLDTYSGCTITFNNQALKHCVNNVSRIDPSKPSHRFLLTFFYTGPAGVPAALTPINEFEHIVDLRAIEAADTPEKKRVENIEAVTDSTHESQLPSYPPITVATQRTANLEISDDDIYMKKHEQQNSISSYFILNTLSTIALIVGASALMLSVICFFGVAATALTGGAVIATAVVGGGATLSGASGFFFNKKSSLESTQADTYQLSCKSTV